MEQLRVNVTMETEEHVPRALLAIEGHEPAMLPALIDTVLEVIR